MEQYFQIAIPLLLLLVILSQRYHKVAGAIASCVAGTTCVVFGIILAFSSKAPLVVFAYFFYAALMYGLGIYSWLDAGKPARLGKKLDAILNRGSELCQSGKEAEALALYTEAISFELTSFKQSDLKEAKSFERLRRIYLCMGMDETALGEMAKELSRLHVGLHGSLFPSGRKRAKQALDDYLKRLPAIRSL